MHETPTPSTKTDSAKAVAPAGVMTHAARSTAVQRSGIIDPRCRGGVVKTYGTERRIENILYSKQ